MLMASHVMMPTAMTIASQILFRFDTVVTLLSTVNTDVGTTDAPSRGCSPCLPRTGTARWSAHPAVGDLVVDHPDVEMAAVGYPTGHAVCPDHERADGIAGPRFDHTDES